MFQKLFVFARNEISWQTAYPRQGPRWNFVKPGAYTTSDVILRQHSTLSHFNVHKEHMEEVMTDTVKLPVTPDVKPPPSPTRKVTQFYRKMLPESCIAFSSDEGRQIFTEALLSGHMKCYFRLAEQFRTQDEPAYCGLSTLVMVLNTLAVDPGKIWKGVWRWYHEDMLDCCVPLNVIQQQGITLDQFVCLSVCNQITSKVVRATESFSLEDFRKVLHSVTQKDDEVMVCAYSRKILGQSGEGHFSPIGGYHPERDLVLVFDVARFKYPPHWVTVTQLWEAMQAIDKDTGLPRGYILMKKDTNSSPVVLFRISDHLSVPINRQHMQDDSVEIFFSKWYDFLRSRVDPDKQTDLQLLQETFKVLLSTLQVLKEDEDILSTQVDMICPDNLSGEHICVVQQLILSLETTFVFQALSDCLNGDEVLSEVASKVGRSSFSDMLCCGSKPCEFIMRLGPQHFLTMFLLSWCYPEVVNNTYGNALSKLMVRQITNTSEKSFVLQNEVNQLRTQFYSVRKYMSKCQCQQECCNRTWSADLL